jgi:hypothetical protein
MHRVYPELSMLFAVPNGGLRNKVVAKKLVGQGVKKGVPDIFLDVSRQGYHGLRIELKRTGPHRTSTHQRAWIQRLTLHGYLATICVGWDAARATIVEYLTEGGDV